jgi:hypothetical protein
MDPKKDKAGKSKPGTGKIGMGSAKPPKSGKTAKSAKPGKGAKPGTGKIGMGPVNKPKK